MTEHKHANILRAIADGKVVQYQDENKWYEPDDICVCNPLTHSHWEWSIKPEKQVLRYRVAKKRSSEGTTALITAYCEDNVKAIESWPSFVEWLHDDWQEVEVG